MTRPTDDELEAMAGDMMFFQPGETSDQAAAMLRACKGRGRVKPLVWEQARDGAGWHHHLTIAYCPLFEKRFYAEYPEKQARIDAAREARILAALEPAPDHSEWNAALEAAAKAAEQYLDDQIDAKGIRALKKGQTDDDN